ncbi:MAG TPA: hypothetical protein VGO43_06335 [Pyrinomonadaceae bacterium]|nr:hypothetical protein [Pyrinomonadaceae bacterium]
MIAAFYLFALSIVVGSAPAQSHSTVPSTPASRTDTVRGEINESYKLNSKGDVFVSFIEGPVEIEIWDKDVAEVHYVREARSQVEYDCESLTIASTDNRLDLRHKNKKSSECQIIQSHETLRLKLPRSANISAEHIEGRVSVGHALGSVKLLWIEGAVTIANAGSAELKWIEGGINLGTEDLLSEGVTIQNVEGSVDLGLAENLNADLQISDVEDRVSMSFASFNTTGNRHERTHTARLGTGGPLISVTDIEGSVRIGRSSVK